MLIGINYLGTSLKQVFVPASDVSTLVLLIKGFNMKFIYAVACTFLLSSCVYYSVQRDFGGDPSAPCTKGSTKDNDRCKAEIKALNIELKNTHND